MAIDPLFDPLTPWEVPFSLTKRRKIYPLPVHAP